MNKKIIFFGIGAAILYFFNKSKTKNIKKKRPQAPEGEDEVNTGGGGTVSPVSPNVNENTGTGGEQITKIDPNVFYINE
jgi:hypothetical protein